ncbi:hypothetical protein BGZ72_004808 [Mortierella alpina]|nr:hypothetical protein BGZ72_004808 [Mortierella alpina]
MVGHNESDKFDPTDQPVVLCVGLATFNSQTGMPSKHSVLEARLVKKMKSLGYPVVGCHEYFTSAKCPRPMCNSFLRNVGRTRSRYCPTCRMHFDRDAVGGENIGRICQAQLERQQRPSKYMPAPRPVSFPPPPLRMDRLPLLEDQPPPLATFPPLHQGKDWLGGTKRPAEDMVEDAGSSKVPRNQ